MAALSYDIELASEARASRIALEAVAIWVDYITSRELAAFFFPKRGARHLVDPIRIEFASVLRHF